MTKSKRKHNERGAGRKPLPDGTAKSKRESCLFRPREYPLFCAAASAANLSRSNLLRAGLRALGVPLDETD